MRSYYAALFILLQRKAYRKGEAISTSKKPNNLLNKNARNIDSPMQYKIWSPPWYVTIIQIFFEKVHNNLCLFCHEYGLVVNETMTFMIKVSELLIWVTILRGSDLKDNNLFIRRKWVLWMIWVNIFSKADIRKKYFTPSGLWLDLGDYTMESCPILIYVAPLGLSWFSGDFCTIGRCLIHQICHLSEAGPLIKFSGGES
jgi:hypothetical protein